MTGLVAPAQVTVATRNVAAASGNSATQAITVATAGNSLIVGVVNTSQVTASTYGTTAVSGAGATWYRGPTIVDGTAGTVDVWFGDNASSGAQTITVTTPGATDSVGIQVEEWSGLSHTSVVLETASYATATGNSTTPSVSPAPANLGDLVWAMALSVNTQTASPAAPYTVETGPTNGGTQKSGVAYWVTSTMTANAASWTQTSAHWAVAAIVLRAAQPTGYGILNATGSVINAAATTPQASPDYVDAAITAASEIGTGVLSGCAVSPNTGSDFKFQVAAGTVMWGGSPITVNAVTAQSVTTSDATNPRRDLVYVDNAGTIHYVAGNAAPTPLIPLLPLTGIALATIEVPANANQVNWPANSSQAYVNDKRVSVSPVGLTLRDYWMSNTTGVSFENWPRAISTVTTSAITSGTLLLTGIALPAGLPVGHITFAGGGGAASTPTHYWFGLFDSSVRMLAVTADQTTTAWAGSAVKQIAIATTAQGSQASFTTTYTGFYYVGFCMTASTVSTLLGIGHAAGGGALLGLAPTIAGTGTASLTTPPAFPFTSAAITPNVNMPAWAGVGV